MWTCYYLDWDLRPLASGSYMVRYTVRDGSGNEGQQTVTYLVDRTAPGAPVNLKGSYGSGIVSVAWEVLANEGVEKYNIYRASAAEGPFTVIGSVDGETSVTYTDASVQTGLTYWYRVTAVDNFDQEGMESNTVAVAAREDDIPPVVLGIEPVDGTIFGPRTEISVRAEDNLALANITLQYSDNGGFDWVDIDTKVPVDGAGTFTWNTLLLDG